MMWMFCVCMVWVWCFVDGVAVLWMCGGGIVDDVAV